MFPNLLWHVKPQCLQVAPFVSYSFLIGVERSKEEQGHEIELSTDTFLARQARIKRGMLFLMPHPLKGKRKIKVESTEATKRSQKN